MSLVHINTKAFSLFFLPWDRWTAWVFLKARKGHCGQMAVGLFPALDRTKGCSDAVD
jgi:hypothetical protein